MNTRLSATELSVWIEDRRPTIIVITEDYRELIDQALAATRLVVPLVQIGCEHGSESAPMATNTHILRCHTSTVRTCEQLIVLA